MNNLAPPPSVDPNPQIEALDPRLLGRPRRSQSPIPTPCRPCGRGAATQRRCPRRRPYDAPAGSAPPSAREPLATTHPILGSPPSLTEQRFIWSNAVVPLMAEQVSRPSGPPPPRGGRPGVPTPGKGGNVPATLKRSLPPIQTELVVFTLPNSRRTLAQLLAHQPRAWTSPTRLSATTHQTLGPHTPNL